MVEVAAFGHFSNKSKSLLPLSITVANNLIACFAEIVAEAGVNTAVNLAGFFRANALRTAAKAAHGGFVGDFEVDGSYLTEISGASVDALVAIRTGVASS
ncbi:hypothetical protein [Kutzneria buriramensis]|uniref:hypothetical protein n=1 Tax=Kutzneria buriramensis TaxID=1045776 RepID=UPI0011C1C21F|nr:hypothetical protein [Kutzneria buriramensis]